MGLLKHKQYVYMIDSGRVEYNRLERINIRRDYSNKVLNYGISVNGCSTYFLDKSEAIEHVYNRMIANIKVGWVIKDWELSDLKKKNIENSFKLKMQK